MSKRKKVWLVVSVMAALVVLIPLSLCWQAQWQLGAYRKILIAAGEKLTMEELAPKRNAQATNTARFLRLASTLPPFGNYAPSAMLSVKPGVARVAWRQSQCLEEGMDTSKPEVDVWPALIGAVRTNEQTLGELQSMLDVGGIDLIEDYNQPNFNGNTYLLREKILVIALRASAILALHQGRMQEANHYLRSCLAVSELSAHDKALIGQMVRYSCMTVAAYGCWEALQAGGWTDDQLFQMQRQWDQGDILKAMEATLSMERARAAGMFQMARTSRQGLNDLTGAGSNVLLNNAEIWNAFLLNARSGIRAILTSYPRYWGWGWIWSFQDERRYMEGMQSMIETTREAQKRHSMLAFLNDRKSSPKLNPPSATSFDVIGPMIYQSQRCISVALRSQTLANMVTAAIALERFRLAHHAYPDTLANLTPDFLQAVPVDCMDGRDLRYRANPDGTYLLYSVGNDGVDNGGDPTPEPGNNAGFLNGRDWVSTLR